MQAGLSTPPPGQPHRVALWGCGRARSSPLGDRRPSKFPLPRRPACLPEVREISGRESGLRWACSDLKRIVAVPVLSGLRVDPTCNCASPERSARRARQTAAPSGIAARNSASGRRPARRAAASPEFRRWISCNSGAAVCIRNASSKELIRPSRARSGPVNACQLLLIQVSHQVQFQALQTGRSPLRILDERDHRLIGRNAGISERRPLVDSAGRKAGASYALTPPCGQRGTHRDKARAGPDSRSPGRT